MEKAARKVDQRIKTLRRCSYADWIGETFLVNSNGVSLSNKDSYCYLVCVPIAEENAEKQMDAYYTVKRHLKELEKPEDVGRIAAERAIKKLGASPVSTTVAPVVFDPIAGAGFMDSLAVCLYGSLIYRNSSFLSDKLGKQIGSKSFSLIDDGRLPRGLNSAMFDGEGVPTKTNWLITDGKVSSFIYNEYYARKMKTATTGNATRDDVSLPYIGTHNLYMLPGDRTPDDIIAEVDEGLYLTSTMGSGFNMATGDFSYGAQGFWISKGKIGKPVSSITIAGTMQELLANIDVIGNDLNPKGGTFTPTFRVSKMSIGGE